MGMVASLGVAWPPRGMIVAGSELERGDMVENRRAWDGRYEREAKSLAARLDFATGLAGRSCPSTGNR
jgi:hypothetical protein